MRRDRYCVPGIQHVLRFWNNEVFENTEGVLQAIYDALTPTLSQREREFHKPWGHKSCNATNC